MQKLGALPVFLPNKWSMLFFNSIKQNYKSQRWLINLNRLLCMKFFFNSLVEKAGVAGAALSSSVSGRSYYLLEILVIFVF